MGEAEQEPREVPPQPTAAPDDGAEPIADLELIKLAFDWCKHIATLSTGSILLMITFREKLVSGREPSWKGLLPLALGGFVAAMIGSLGVQFEFLRVQSFQAPRPLGTVSIFLLLMGFLTGIICLTLFGIINLR